MPRAYAPDEWDRIRQRLLDVGRERFAAHGLKKVTVAELTRAVGIGTGSLYLFFPSKEDLFFDIQEAEERAFKLGVEQELAGLVDPSPALTVHTFLSLQSEVLERHPFLRRLLDPDTIRALLRRVDPERLAAHRDHDAAWMRGLAEDWLQAGVLAEGTAPDALLEASTALFVLATQREVVGPAYPAVRARVLRALVRDLVGGASDDEALEGPADGPAEQHPPPSEQG